ncbi:MAG: hypothetical protein U1E99_12400 [Agitococcus sp.]|mgnify:CR=1 FL=1
MSGKYLLDTCLLIGLQQRYPDALALVTSHNLALQDCAFSVISRIELLRHGLTLLTLDKRLESLSLVI